jgi:hypothetical protein
MTKQNVFIDAGVHVLISAKYTDIYMRAQRCEANGKEQLQWQFAAHVNCIQMAS